MRSFILFAVVCVQFTYFQQAGGRSLSVPAVEITYGLERILMSLQVRMLLLSALTQLGGVQTVCRRYVLHVSRGITFVLE